jgi:hypothetical protein
MLASYKIEGLYSVRPPQARNPTPCQLYFPATRIMGSEECLKWGSATESKCGKPRPKAPARANTRLNNSRGSLFAIDQMQGQRDIWRR